MSKKEQAREIIKLVEEKIDNFDLDVYLQMQQMNLGIISSKMQMLYSYLKDKNSDDRDFKKLKWKFVDLYLHYKDLKQKVEENEKKSEEN